MPNKNQLLFIYDAKSGLINGTIDNLHKIFSPKTYTCKLYGLTYNNYGRKNRWNNYLNTLNMEIEFYYRDNIYSKIKYFNEQLSCMLVFKKVNANY